jgi:hypothetical protein
LSALSCRGVLARLHSDERGAVGTIFAMLLGTGVLLGMLALVIDIGLLYAEREELQSGADAAAIAVAQECAQDRSLAGCSETDMIAVAKTFANRNARDGKSNILEVCGTLGALEPCGDPIGNLTDCIPATPTGTAPYVEVRTGTEMADGDFIYPPTFAQTLSGNGGYQGSTVRACARATLGTPARGMALTFSHCEWAYWTNSGAKVANGPDFVPGTSVEVVLKTHDSQNPPPPGCEAEEPGSDAPGAFGWTNRISKSGCETELFNGVYSTETGNDAPNACRDALDDATKPGARPTVFYIPIFESVTGTGANTKYKVSMVAAFVPTGYFLGEGKPWVKSSWLPGSSITECRRQERCVYGYFVNVTGPGEVGPGGLTSLGANVLGLSG